MRDRGDVSAEEKIRFTSSILPKWARRTKSLDGLLPVLYLRGVSTGDFQEALAALLGKDAPNLSPAVISRLDGRMAQDYDVWQDLTVTWGSWSDAVSAFSKRGALPRRLRPVVQPIDLMRRVDRPRQSTLTVARIFCAEGSACQAKTASCKVAQSVSLPAPSLSVAGCPAST